MTPALSEEENGLACASVVRRHPQIAFFVLAYAVAWAFVPFGSFGAFGPLVAALIVIPLTRGRAGLRELGSRLVRWRVRWFWYLVALGLPLAYPPRHRRAEHRSRRPDVPSVTAASVSAAVLTFLLRLVNPTDGPLGEEPGWRGFALPGLQSRYSPLAATTILAVARRRLAPAALLPRGGRIATARSRGGAGHHYRGDLLVLVAVQPHGRQRAPGPHCTQHRGQPSGAGMDRTWACGASRRSG